jgi:hypothetical protein
VGGGGGGSYVSVRLLHGGEFVLVEGVGHFNDWLMWAPSGADNGCRGGVGDAGCEYSGVRCFLVGLGSGWWGGISAEATGCGEIGVFTGVLDGGWQGVIGGE